MHCTGQLHAIARHADTLQAVTRSSAEYLLPNRPPFKRARLRGTRGEEKEISAVNAKTVSTEHPVYCNRSLFLVLVPTPSACCPRHHSATTLKQVRASGRIPCFFQKGESPGTFLIYSVLKQYSAGGEGNSLRLNIKSCRRISASCLLSHHVSVNLHRPWGGSHTPQAARLE